MKIIDDNIVDQATNGLDDPGHYFDPVTKSVRSAVRNGPDDVGERETAPPYDKPPPRYSSDSAGLRTR